MKKKKRKENDPSLDTLCRVGASQYQSILDPVRTRQLGRIREGASQGLLPNDPKEASKLRSRSSRFTIHRGALYKRGFFTPILKCIAKEDANYVLREVHEGVCGYHIGARALAGKVLRRGYYWPTILRDATELVRKCKVC